MDFFYPSTESILKRHIVVLLAGLVWCSTGTNTDKTLYLLD